MKFSAVLLFMVLWFTFSYVPMAHMVWFWPGPDAYTAANVVDAKNATAGLLWQWGASRILASSGSAKIAVGE